MSKTIEKLEILKDIIRSMESVVVAFSGGVDSTLLLKTASGTLGEKVLAVTASSKTYPCGELKEARRIAKDLKVNHLVIETDELNDPNFVRNSKERCYWCKRELFLRLREVAKTKEFCFVVDGTNLDDTYDFRPGRKAQEEFKVRTPLAEANLAKKEVRELSKFFNLFTWDKPQAACLASRILYGVRITEMVLKKIEEAENYLKELGFREVRVRHHGEIARIEVGEKEVGRIINIDTRNKISDYLKKLGYVYVTFDLEGYRPGSMNELINKEAKRQDR